MRTTLICLCFLIIGHRGGSRAENYEEFKPTPIPLNEWKGSMVEGNASAGTLHEVVATDPPTTLALVPAHYWEDALRHSVYLTLVRDKIDQLIAKGTLMSPDTKPDYTASKEVDDHDLWEKIKAAPFDRLKPKEAPALGDITILAKGRLLESKDGFRFAEDDTSKEKCSDAKCMDGVKAFWSVKRVRQRDAETVPGKYHYELTFSITSQTQKQHKKPYDNPVRTFTVLESNPTEEPKFRTPLPTKYVPRPQRAIWIHKNINPVPNYHSRKTYQGSSLDRLFFSLFSDDDDYKEDYQPRYKPPVYQPQTAQQSKVGHAGPVEQYHQKKVPPYRYKPQSFKYPYRPPVAQNFAPAPIPQPPVQPLKDYETKYIHQQQIPDHKYLPTNIVKTTKPAVLPTPTFTEANYTFEITNRPNTTESTTKEPETVTYKIYTKQKQPPTKVSHFPEHVRPPVFNAPPGVFVTMEKKPFKPMPPLKVPYYHTKPMRSKPPVDFRPSPQVLDAQFSDPEPLSDSFRPITMNYADHNTTVNSAEFLSKNRTKLKPPKKHENRKSHRTTTSTPEIITAQQSLSMDKITLESMQWANNILGAFSKTTPMAYEKFNFSNIDDFLTKPITTTTAVPAETTWVTTTEEEVATTTTTEPSTTTEFISKAKKRTRPPPKFTELKENPIKKVKKHKRITSTTSTTTTMSPTTVRSRPLSKRPLPDITPQASSAATNNKDLEPKIQNDTFTTTSSTVDLKDTTTSIPTTTPRSTPATRSTTRTSITTTSPTTTTVSTTTEARNKNRFRQTMLMQKGTSVKHDKWSTTNNSYIDKTKTVIPLASKLQQARRKASNFHGYVSSTQTTVEEERNKDDHRDRLPDSYFNEIRNTAVKPLETNTQTPTQKTTAEHTTNVESPPHDSDEIQHNDMKEQEANTEEVEDEQEIIDHSEYIFSVTTEASNGHELGDPELITVTEISVINTPYSSGKNKTKCKKKKQGNSTLTDEASPSSNDSDETLNSTTESSAVSDIFDEIFGFTAKDNFKPNRTHTEQIHEGSEHHEHYVHAEDDLETFLESLSINRQEQEAIYDESEEDSGDDYTNNREEESRTLRHEDIPEHREVRERPLSFLELMAME